MRPQPRWRPAPRRRVSIPDRRKPSAGLDRLREETDVFSREPVGVEVFDDGRRVERTRSQPVVDDVVPHLEGEDPPHEYLVEDTPAEPVQVIEVADLAPPAPGSELLGQRLLQRRSGEGWKLELVPLMDWQVDRAEGGGREPERTWRDFDLGRESGRPSGVSMSSVPRNADRLVTWKETPSIVALSSVSSSSSPVSASGAAKSRSVENRPSLPARNLRSDVPPLSTTPRSKTPCRKRCSSA